MLALGLFFDLSPNKKTPEFLRRFFSARIQLIFDLLHILFLIFHHVSGTRNKDY